MRLVALAAAALLAVAPAAGAADDASVRFLASRERPGGGFAESTGTPGLRSRPGSLLGLHAQGRDAVLDGARAYLLRTEPPRRPGARARADGALGARPRDRLARRAPARGAAAERPDRPDAELDDLGRARAPAGAGSRPAGDEAPAAAASERRRRLVLDGRRRARHERHGRRGAGAPRARRPRPADLARPRLPAAPPEPDGGFELTRGRGSDSQSTAWAIQAFAAAGAHRAEIARSRYLARMRRPDGSYRYSRRYPAATPVWVTAQVLPALARKPFPLR